MANTSLTRKQQPVASSMISNLLIHLSEVGGGKSVAQVEEAAAEVQVEVFIHSSAMNNSGSEKLSRR